MKPPALGLLCAHAEGMIEYKKLYRSEDSIAEWVGYGVSEEFADG